jgi:ribosomal protein S12 methylthiotransferase accessory factor
MRSGIQLQNAFKTYIHELDKLVSPQETIQTVRDKLKKTGPEILLKNLRIDTGRLGIPVYLSLCGTDAVRTIGTKADGEGCTRTGEASALMELVERYSFFRFIKMVISWNIIP